VLNNMGIVYEMPKIGKKAILGDVRVGNEAVIGRESAGLHEDYELGFKIRINDLS